MAVVRADGIGTFEFDTRKTLNANFALHFLVLGTSPPFDMFTTSHEKEEGLPKTMRLQERKGKVKKGSGTQIKSNLI